MKVSFRIEKQILKRKLPEKNSKPCQMPEMELLAKIATRFQPLTVFAKASIFQFNGVQNTRLLSKMILTQL